MGTLRGCGGGCGRGGGRVICLSRKWDRGRAIYLARGALQSRIERKCDVRHLDYVRAFKHARVEGGATMRGTTGTLAGRGLRFGLSPAMGTACRLLATAWPLAAGGQLGTAHLLVAAYPLASARALVAAGILRAHSPSPSPSAGTALRAADTPASRPDDHAQCKL